MTAPALLQNPSSHEPERQGGEEHGDGGKPAEIDKSREEIAGRERPADIYEVIERCDEGDLCNNRGKGVERKEDA